MKKHLGWIILLSLAAPQLAHAFTGFVRDGYTSCTSCHVSPNGGGVLTQYGRELSQELLSTFSGPKEGEFLYGAFADKIPETLLLGGDVRAIQTYRSNPVFTEKRFFLMQADFEAALTVKKFLFDIEAGYVDSEMFDSLRHYVMYRFDDTNNLRLGRFYQSYGLLILPEHTITVRRNLGWDEGTETYNLEFSHLGERVHLFATALFGRPESVSSRRGFTIGQTGYADHGASARGAFFFDTSEVGVSAFYGMNSAQGWRTVFGPYFTFGFTPHLYWQAEVDFQNAATWGVFDYQKLNWEFIQGLHLYGVQELALPTFGQTASRTLRYGLGFQAFPRPHLELDLRWYWEKNPYDETGFGSNLAWAMLHLYF